METIEKDGMCYAVIHRKEDWKEGLDFLTADEMFCQVGTWWYQKGKILNGHRHISALVTFKSWCRKFIYRVNIDYISMILLHHYFRNLLGH